MLSAYCLFKGPYDIANITYYILLSFIAPPYLSSQTSSDNHHTVAGVGFGRPGRPVQFNSVYINQNDKFGGFLNGIFGENRHGYHKIKRKIRRKIKNRPCIPQHLLDQFRTGRDANGDPIDPKTLKLFPDINLILADLNVNAPNNHYGGNGGLHDDGDGSDSVSFNSQFYNTYGGYPCRPWGSHNHNHHNNRPGLGFFGSGGLFDFSGSRPGGVQSDTPGILYFVVTG